MLQNLLAHKYAKDLQLEKVRVWQILWRDIVEAKTDKKRENGPCAPSNLCNTVFPYLAALFLGSFGNRGISGPVLPEKYAKLEQACPCRDA